MGLIISFLGVKLYIPYLPSIPSPGLPSYSPPSDIAASSGQPIVDMRMLRLYSLTDLHNCPLDNWGILDPGLRRRDIEEAQKREDGMCWQGLLGYWIDVLVVKWEDTPPLDLVLLPGVAFDRDCNRVSSWFIGTRPIVDLALLTWIQAR